MSESSSYKLEAGHQWAGVHCLLVYVKPFDPNVPDVMKTEFLDNFGVLTCSTDHVLVLVGSNDFNGEIVSSEFVLYRFGMLSSRMSS